MRIQNNITAMNTHRMYTANNNAISKSAEKLSSGYRINRAGDDAAGLAISEKMRSQIRGLNMASKNSQDANSLIQTAEGALQEVHSMLQRMGELANQSATGTNENFDRSQISAEFDQLKAEINDISTQTNFNNMKLLDGTLASGAAKVQVDSASGLAVGNTINAGDAADHNYTITGQTGLSSQVGTYSITASGSSITVNFTDEVTQNQTNTTIDLSAVTSGDFKAGGAFKVDLSAAGMGVFEMSASNLAAETNDVDATNLATALAAASTAGGTSGALKAVSGTATGLPSTIANVTANSVTYDATGVDGVGKYTIATGATAGTIDITDEAGNKATLTLEDVTATADNQENVLADLSAVTIGGKTVNLGKISGVVTATADPAEAADIATALDGVVINASGADGNGGLKIQVGANEGEQLTISVEKMNVDGLGLTDSKIDTQEKAGKAITATQKAINLVSEQRATLGAMQNRLEHKISNLDNTSENLSASESRIRDVDIAKEMTAFTKNQILSQASTAMLAQANSMPQNVLSLLQ